MGGFFGGGGASVDLASPSAIGSTTPNTGAFTTLSFAPAANATGLSSSSYSLTGSNAQSLVSLTGTWNTTGTPSAILLDITDTASNTNSRLFNLRVGGSNMFGVRKDGALMIRGGGNNTRGIEADASYFRVGNTNANWIFFNNNFYCMDSLGTGTEFAIGNTGGSACYYFGLRAAGRIVWDADINQDLEIRRDAADTLAQRRGVNSQTFRLYRTFTDASNYERLSLICTRTTRFAIAAENAGTGAARSLEISFYTSASDPTSTDITSGCFSVWKNSGTGTIKLWANDGGTMKSVSLA